MPVAICHLMNALIPDWIWKLLPDSMGGFISLVWIVLFWILRRVALWRSETGSGSSPYRGLLCSGAALCGVVAFTAGGLVLLALNHMQSFGILLAIVCVPLFLLTAPCSYMFYRAARDGVPSRAEPNHLRPPDSPTTRPSDRQDAA
jgi:L-asparagine transporter-like permease